MNDVKAPLRNNIRLLGQLLEETIQRHPEETFFNKIEVIRTLGMPSQEWSIAN